MQKKFKLLSTLGLMILSVVLMSNRGGSPLGRSGSSTDASTCGTNGGCHNNGNPPTSKEMLSINVPTKGYSPDSTYRITINASQGARDVFGFEMMAEDSSGTGVGNFVGDTAVTAHGVRATHKFASSFGSDGITWETDWTAPAAGTGTLKLYIAVLAANNNQTTGGDIVLVDTLDIVENLTASTPKFERVSVKVFPNPSENQLFIAGKFSERAHIKFIDPFGKIVLNQAFSPVVNIAELPSGMYHVVIDDHHTQSSTVFVKL